MKNKITDREPYIPKDLFALLVFFALFALLALLIVAPLFFMFFAVVVASMVIGGYQLSKNYKHKQLSDGYRQSVREALRTEHPDGIVYILEKTLEQLARFDINHPPERTSITGGIAHDDGRSSSSSDVKGFPNQTNLREAIRVAQYLSREWAQLNPVEQSRSMADIRAKIQPEDISLDVEKFNLSKEQLEINVYWFSYNVDDIIDLGISYFKSKNYQQAIAEYTKAIQIDPNNTDTYNNRGFAYYKLKDYQNAITDYNAAIKLNPNYAYAYNNSGLVYYEYGNIDEAIELLQKAISIKACTNDNIESQLHSKLALAVVLYTKGEQQEAIKITESVLNSDKRFGNVQFLNEEQGWNDKLIADTQKLLENYTLNR